MTLLQRIKTPFTESPAEDAARARPRRSVGESLRERREELALDLDGIGETLRIKPAYLVALEQGRSHELPGPTYAIGFVRAYAHYLGLDEEAVLSRFKEESSGLTTRQDLSLPVPLGERSLPGAAMLLVALILVLCGYGTWYYLSTGERSRPERVAAVPAALQSRAGSAGSASAATEPAAPPSERGVGPTAALNPPSASTASPGAPAGAGPAAVSMASAAPPAAAPAAPPAPAPASAVTAEAATIRTAAPAAPQPGAAAPAAPATSAAPAASPSAAQRVAIKALADCWIQVRGPDQSIVFSRVLKSGEVYKVPSKPGLFLRTGNAGALEIAVDGKRVPAIGAVGTLRREVVLDPDALIAGKAVHG